MVRKEKVQQGQIKSVLLACNVTLSWSELSCNVAVIIFLFSVCTVADTFDKKEEYSLGALIFKIHI